jgi:NAD(P)-dependent dehydrogenase (short-subunit alcohol dehydrogenase family)
VPPALAGHTAVVTGASRGIGLACARALALAGARVAMLARSAPALEREASGIGDGALAVPCDLGSAEGVAAAVALVRQRLADVPDILVNNAGIFSVAPVGETSPEVFAHTLGVNLIAPFLLARAFAPAMRERGSGHVITIGSVADHVAHANNTAYSASKFGVRGVHEALRAELRGSGARATLISPGPVDTPIWDAINPDTKPGFTPRARMLDASAVAAAVMYVVTQPPSVNVDELRLSRS